MNVLNPVLYERLRKCLGEVRVSSAGEPRVVRTYGVSPDGAPRRQVRTPGETYAVCCPFCSDRRFRLYVNHAYGVPDERGARSFNLAHCFNEDCMASLENRDALREMLESWGGYNPVLRKVAAPPPPRAVVMPDECVDLRDLVARGEPNAGLDYLASRRFDPAHLAERYGVCWCVDDAKYRMARGRLIIPILKRGKLVGYQARYPGELPWKEEWTPPKYWTAPGTPLREVLYNSDQAFAFATVVLVEGVADVWRFGPMAAALFGCRLEGARLDWFKDLAREMRRSVVILLDADRAGQAHVGKLRSVLSDKLGPRRVVSVDLAPGSDPAVYTRAELRAIVTAQAESKGVRVSFKRLEVSDREPPKRRRELRPRDM